ncbi:hypothetical protein PHMEG_00017617 [Phytophthora megakarya]|uniref:Uncharacterized protein n=1 Tax=Phytophthora megakarya TaxID=4795 RepID=A0A225VXN2_9STRA|nr:hypothetical protein PHMEG_00017617 [Phytophthora megakarya]
MPLVKQTKNRASLDDVHKWLAAPPPADDEVDDGKDVDDEKQYQVRKLWNWKCVTGKTYFLVN